MFLQCGQLLPISAFIRLNEEPGGDKPENRRKLHPGAPLSGRPDAFFVDEVGPMELRGEGWAPALDRLGGLPAPVVWVVRPKLVEEVRRRWEWGEAEVVEAASASAAAFAEMLLGRLPARQAACR
jgi:hypothetical protein